MADTGAMIRLGLPADLPAASDAYRRASLFNMGDRDNLRAHPDYLILGPDGPLSWTVDSQILLKIGSSSMEVPAWDGCPSRMKGSCAATGAATSAAGTVLMRP